MATRTYDAIFIHPPAIYDFRGKTFFPGPIAQTVRKSTSQFITIPIGVFSIAEYLKRHGYKVMVVNLGGYMASLPSFDVDNHVRKIEADVYAVDLHWCVHSQGSIEVARLVKKHHPHSQIILGGLTATRFHDEIIKKYTFIDGVIRGEAEKPMLQFLEKLKDPKKSKVKNLTYRNNSGRVCVNPSMKVCKNLDEFDFTKIDLVESKEKRKKRPRSWAIPICRGCIFNCISCGGSAYAYKTLLNRERPAFRTPEKIIEDLELLEEQKVDTVFLFQDPRMGGKKYWKKLFSLIRAQDLKFDKLILELFTPANEEYVKEASSTRIPVTFTISPESGVESVRRAQGRNYSNNDLVNTVKLCQKQGVSLGLSFMIPLSEDTGETVKNTLRFCEKLHNLDKSSQPITRPPLTMEIGPMILLDPGSLAFDFPEKYGYRLLFKNFEDHYRGMSTNFWHRWISYETKFLSREEIAEQMIYSLEHLIQLEDKYNSNESLLWRRYVTMEKFKIRANRIIIDEADRMDQYISEEAEDRMRALKRALKECPRSFSTKTIPIDPYGYTRRIDKLLYESMLS